MWKKITIIQKLENNLSGTNVDQIYICTIFLKFCASNNESVCNATGFAKASKFFASLNMLRKTSFPGIDFYIYTDIRINSYMWTYISACPSVFVKYKETLCKVFHCSWNTFVMTLPPATVGRALGDFEAVNVDRGMAGHACHTTRRYGRLYTRVL